jgi:5-carboxymethyl-2-hydroxymuconate isomerase
MPHFVIDYSPNLEGELDVGSLVECVRKEAVASGIFPLGGIRVRAHKAEAASLADGKPEHAYVDLTLRLASGRDLATRKRVGAAVFEAISRHLDPLFARRRIMLSFEVKEIDPELSWKRNTVHDALKGQG